MKLSFLGTADAFHGGGRRSTSVLVEDVRGRMLVDCGPTTPLALAQLGVPLASIGEVVLTHLYGDHFSGTVGLLLDGVAHGRRGPLVIAGPALTASRVEALFRTTYPSSAERVRGFLLDYREIEPGDAIDVGGRRLLSRAARHPAGALSFRLESEGKVVAFSGDTGPEADLAGLADGADLFVCECSLPAGERSERHLSVDDVRARRRGWNAKQVVLVHLSAASRAGAEGLADVVVADDGMTVSL